MNHQVILVVEGGGGDLGIVDDGICLVFALGIC